MRKVFVAIPVAVLMMLGGIGFAPNVRAASTTRLIPTTIGEAIVGFDRGLLPNVKRGGRLNGLPVTRVSKNGSFLTVKAPSLNVVRTALTVIPGVSYVEDNGLMHALATPNDTRYGEQYGPALMGFPAAWGSVGYGNANVTVAVIDSGVLSTHQDLAGPRLLQGHDYISNDNTPNDTCGHGTHTIGTVGASTNNATGVAGMAQVTLLPMKALNYVKPTLLGGGGGCSGAFAGIAQAIMDAADQGASVISMSIGGGASSVMENAVNYATAKGAILVAAAGNDGGTNSIDYPAAYPAVIAVGAVTSTKARASYSDGGPQLDIAAPGSNVLSTYTGANNATYSLLSGTSMATPHVAGALALALGCKVAGTTTTQVVNALFSTAEDLGAAGRDNLYGSGLARADLLARQVCNGTPPPNQNPTAAFTATPSGSLGVAVDASTSHDPDGDLLSYTWNFGDTATATGKTANHTYASAGSKTIRLTVTDGRGGSSTAETVFNASADPDPATPTLTSGQTVGVGVSSTATERFFKIAVPAGKTQLKAVTAGPACSLLSCPLDADLYTRAGSRPTDSAYSCRAMVKGNAENCTSVNPTSGYWYIRVKRYSGSGSVNLTVTLT